MFLNIKKIGKTKQKFKGKFTFLKFVNESTERGVCFKIKLQRGQHKIEAISQPSRKGIARFKNTQYEIPMTLYCEQDQNQISYLEKQAVIKVYQCDEKGSEIRKIGTKQINLSEFVKQGRIKIQIQLDPQKKIDDPVLTIQLLIQRQPDDSKSVDTISSNNEKRRQQQILIQEQQQRKNKQKKRAQKRKQIASQGTPSKIKNQLGLKRKQKQKQNRSQNGDYTQAQKIEVKVRKYEDERKRTKNQDLYEQGLKKIKQSQNSVQLNTLNKMQNNEKIQMRKRQKSSQIKPIMQQQVDQKQAKSIKNIKGNNQLHTQFKQGQSPQLQVFLLRKALKQKQSQLSSMKRQNQTYKKTIDKLVEQTSTVKQRQKKHGIQKQLQQMKKALTSKDIIIDKLTTQNKSLNERTQEYEKTILKLRQDLLIDRAKISDIKYKQAYLMQQLFQTGNKQALQQASRFLSV